MTNSIPNSISCESDFLDGYHYGYEWITECYGELSYADDELIYMGLSDNQDYVVGFKMGAKDAHKGLDSKY